MASDGDAATEKKRPKKPDKDDESGHDKEARKSKTVKAKTQGADNFGENDKVQFQRKATADDTGWKQGTIRLCRKDNTFDVVDDETAEIVKRVPAEQMKKARSKEKSKSDIASDEDKELSLHENDSVEFKTAKGTWRSGRIKKMRKDGTFDVSHDSDSDQVSKGMNRELIRIARKKSKSKKDDKSLSVRKRKSRRDSEQRLDPSSDSEDGNGKERSGSSSKARRRKNQPAGISNLSFAELRVNQMIDFEDKDGSIHRGRIKLLREEDETCDVQHASDDEVVSKKVPIDRISRTPTLTRLWQSNWNRGPANFQLYSRVFYQGRDGVDRRGIVMKIWKDDKGESPSYDVEDELDGSLVKRLPGSKLRPIPWVNFSLPSLPAWRGPTMGNFSFLPSTILRKGMKVRFRLRNSKSGRIAWEDGIIIKANTGATCMIEYVNSAGEKEQTQVKNRDIQSRFQLPFNGIGDLFPSIQMPKRMFAEGSAVEVTSGSKVFLGTVVSASEQDNTYVILYSDGRKEKKVQADRVRLSLRKLKIGTEVEMIVEGPCKEVSKLDGEVAWVHRDEKVAVRINGGNNDIFAEVCSHALIVDGKPAFSAPITSTLMELVGFYCNLALETIVYMWFCFGMIVELGEMIQLLSSTSQDELGDVDSLISLYNARNVDWSTCQHTPLFNGSSSYLKIPSDFISTDRSWLVTLCGIKAIATACCTIMAFRLIQSKITAIQDKCVYAYMHLFHLLVLTFISFYSFIDIREHQQDCILHRHFARFMGFAITISYLTLVVYASLLNRLEYYCLLESSTDLRFGTLALQAKLFAIHTQYKTVIDLLIGLAAKTAFNLFRALAFYLLVFAFPTTSSFLYRILCLLPTIALTALLCAMGIASLQIFYSVQRVDIVQKGVYSLSAETDWAILGILVTIWFNRSIYELVAACGRFYDAVYDREVYCRGDVTPDVLDQAERGEFGLQAKREARYVKVEQQQQELGISTLTVMRVRHHVALHLLTMTLGIIGDAILHPAVSSVSQQSVVLHLAVCISWLFLSLLSSLYAARVLQQHSSMADIVGYILDV